MTIARNRFGKVMLMFIPMLVLAAFGGLILRQALRHHVTPPAQTPVASGPLSVKPRSYLGVFEPKAAQSWQTVSAFGTAAGRQPNIVLVYSGWGEPFHAQLATTAHKHHAMLLVQLQPWRVRLSDIAAGKYDRYLHHYADEVKKFGNRTILSFGHEMNGIWYPWGHTKQSASSWIAAWRHIVTVFRAEGAANATWLWDVSSSHNWSSFIPDYWPGGKYVDWVGVDGYYFRHDATFRSTFGPALRQIESVTHKPVLLAETGIGPVAGQARNIPDLFKGIRRNRMLGLVWFDRCQHRGLFHQCWALQHPQSVSQFHKWVARMSAG